MTPDLFSRGTPVQVPADTRPVLIGMNNPLSVAPEYALYPVPDGCTGHRIFVMIQSVDPNVTRSSYARAFDRRNLCRGPWSARLGRTVAELMLPELAGREVVVLGAEPRKAFGLESILIHPQRVAGVIFRTLPHPSGRNLWYNDSANRRMAAMLLAELYAKSAALGDTTGSGPT